MLEITFQHINSVKNSSTIGWKRIFVFLAMISFFSVASQTPKTKADSIVAKLGIQNRLKPNSLENIVTNQKREKQNKYLNDQSIQKQAKIFNLVDLEIQNA